MRTLTRGPSSKYFNIDISIIYHVRLFETFHEAILDLPSIFLRELVYQKSDRSPLLSILQFIRSIKWLKRVIRKV